MLSVVHHPALRYYALCHAGLDYQQSTMSKGNEINLSYKGISSEEFRQILSRLSSSSSLNCSHENSHEERQRNQRTQQNQDNDDERVTRILANQPTTNICKLNFHGNQSIGDEGMKYLHFLPASVTYLGLGRCGLSPVGIQILCEFLKTNITVQCMVMRANKMGSEGIKHVVEMVKVNKTITYLGLSSCEISAEDCVLLSQGLAVNTRICQLYIGDGDKLTDDHVRNLCPGLAMNKALETLSLLCPSGTINEEGIGYMENVLRFHNVHLKQISVYKGNYIPTGSGTIWEKTILWLSLNKNFDRKLIQDPHCTLSRWQHAIIHAAEVGMPDAVFMFLRNKPEFLKLMM